MKKAKVRKITKAKLERTVSELEFEKDRLKEQVDRLEETCAATRLVGETMYYNEERAGDDFKEFACEELAAKIGKKLLDDGFIKFWHSCQADPARAAIKAEVRVVKPRYGINDGENITYETYANNLELDAHATEEDIMEARDLMLDSLVRAMADCGIIKSGTWLDPYTGKLVCGVAIGISKEWKRKQNPKPGIRTYTGEIVENDIRFIPMPSDPCVKNN